MNFDIFCNVVDNFGDAGVCLRLARELTVLGDSVCLYCNNPATLNTIVNSSDLENEKLCLKIWDKHTKDSYQASEVAVAAFSCRIEDEILKKIEDDSKLIINLEYLSAEPFVDDFHTLPSPLYKIPCCFFFPGFTSKSGGLNFESSFMKKIKNSKELHLNGSGCKKPLTITLFSYSNPSSAQLFHELTSEPIFKGAKLLVFEGLPLDNFNKRLNLHLKVNDEAVLENDLEVKVLPMLSQDEYDDLILSSDLNFVRGEDSISRAILSGLPFIWQIYPQDENAHIVKLNSFLDRIQEYCKNSDEKERFRLMRQVMLAYNGAADYPQERGNLALLLSLKEVFLRSAQAFASHGSLAENLRRFCTAKLGRKSSIGLTGSSF